MKKIDTKKTLTIENKKLILEDYDDADGFKDWKNMVKTGLDAFKSFAGMLKDIIFVYPGSIAYEYYVNDKTLKAAIMSASKDLDKKYIAYSRKMDSIFEASGVAKDVKAATSLAFLPAIGLDWYVGNEELERIKNEVIKGDGKRLWNNFVQENRRNNKKYFSKEGMEFDIEPEKIYRNSAAREGLNVTLYKAFVLLSQFTSTPSKLSLGYSSFKDLTKAYGNASKVADLIRDTRKPSNSTDALMVRRCLKHLENDAKKYRLDADHIQCLKILYMTKSYSSVDKMITALLVLGRDVNYKLSFIADTIERIAADASLKTPFETAAIAIDPKTIKESVLNTNTSLLIFNDNVELLKEEEEGDKKSSDSDSPSEEDKKTFLEFFARISDIVNDGVKQDLILWNLAKDLSFYNASIATLANLEMFYAQLVLRLNKPEDFNAIDSIIDNVYEEIERSAKSKIEFYNEIVGQAPSDDRVPAGMDKIINDLPTLPKSGINIGNLKKEIVDNYGINNFIKNCKDSKDDADILYTIPKQFLSPFDNLEEFLANDDAVKAYLSLFLKKNLVDTLLGAGAKSKALNKNIEQIDDNLNNMVDALKAMSSNETFDLKKLIEGAVKNENLKDRVETLKKAYQELDNVIEAVEKMEETAKSFEGEGKKLVSNIEKLFTAFQEPEADGESDGGESDGGESDGGESDGGESGEETEVEQSAT